MGVIALAGAVKKIMDEQVPDMFICSHSLGGWRLAAKGCRKGAMFDLGFHASVRTAFGPQERTDLIEHTPNQ